MIIDKLKFHVQTVNFTNEKKATFKHLKYEGLKNYKEIRFFILDRMYNAELRYVTDLGIGEQTIYIYTNMNEHIEIIITRIF